MIFSSNFWLASALDSETETEEERTSRAPRAAMWMVQHESNGVHSSQEKKTRLFSSFPSPNTTWHIRHISIVLLDCSIMPFTHALSLKCIEMSELA